MMVGTLGVSPTLSEEMSSPFTDLGEDNPADFYPHKFVAAAYENGITRGTTPTTFGPWEYITRAQVVTMVVRAAGELAPQGLEDPPPGYSSSWGSFSETHEENARIAEYNGMLEGIEGYGSGWNPWASMPRGEVAELLSALLWMGA